MYISICVAGTEKASHKSVQASSLSLRHGIRCATNAVEFVERVGHCFCIPTEQSGGVLFLKDEQLVNCLIEESISESG